MTIDRPIGERHETGAEVDEFMDVLILDPPRRLRDATRTPSAGSTSSLPRVSPTRSRDVPAGRRDDDASDEEVAPGDDGAGENGPEPHGARRRDLAQRPDAPDRPVHRSPQDGPAGSGPEETDMSKVTVGLWVPLQAKPGKEAEVEAFLKAGQALVEDEPGTTAWFAVRLGGGQFGIFDVFPDDEGRRAHLDGKVAAALMEKAADLFADAPQIGRLDVLAEKL